MTKSENVNSTIQELSSMILLKETRFYFSLGRTRTSRKFNFPTQVSASMCYDKFITNPNINTIATFVQFQIR